MPTLLNLTGYKTKQDLKYDGRDIWPLLTGTVTNPATRTLYWKFTRGRYAIRRGDFKLIVSEEKETSELYDLAVDPYEKNNLAEKQPARVTELKSLLAKQQNRDKSTG